MHPQHSYTQFRLVSARELAAQSYPQPLKQRLTSLVQQTLLWIKNRLFHSSDIRVWRTYSADGTLLWSAHNPITRHAIYGVSESEIRRWIEQCHRTNLR